MPKLKNIGWVLVAAILHMGCQTIQFDRPQAVTEKDWLVDGYTQNRSRSTSDAVELPLDVAWEYNAASAFGPGSPLILNKVLLIGTLKGEIHAIDLISGRKRGYRNFGEGIEASPAISQGILFVPSAWGKKSLVAFDLAKANFLWRNNGTPIESGIVVTDKFVIAADVEGSVRAFDQKTGKLIWEVALGDRISVQSSLLLIDSNAVFVADDSGKASMLSVDDGQLIWSQQLSGPVYESASSLGSKIVVPTTRGTLEVLNSDSGRVEWLYRASNPNVRFGSPAISEDLVIVGGTDGMVRAFEASTGSEKWRVDFPDVIKAAPLIEKRLVFIGTLGRKLFALDLLDGQIRWETTLKGRMKSAMAISEGGLIVLSEPRYVTYFKTAEEPTHAPN